MGIIYADTTVLASRVCGCRDEQTAIEQVIEGHIVSTSGYVVEELRCTFLYDAVLLHKLLVNSSRTDEALRRVNRYFGRHPARMWQLLSLCCDVRGDPLPRKRLINRLEELIEIQLMDSVLACVGEGLLVDSTECARSSGEPFWRGDRYCFACRCQKGDKPTCDIIAFYGQHRAALRRLAKGPRKLDKIHREFRRTARRVLDDPNEGRGTNCYRVLADAVIVLEAPSNMPICSTNASDFEPLCQTLGREFLDARVPRR